MIRWESRYWNMIGIGISEQAERIHIVTSYLGVSEGEEVEGSALGANVGMKVGVDDVGE